jgi:hypothetical protein
VGSICAAACPIYVAVLCCELPLNVPRRGHPEQFEREGGGERERERERIVKIHVILHRWDELQC